MKLFLPMALTCYLFVGLSLASGCNHPRYMSVGNQCQEVTCDNNSQCSQFKSQCTTGKGSAICRASAKICGCSEEWISGLNEGVSNCNNQKSGKSNCKAGQVCTSAGYCIKNPICSTRAEKCGPNKFCCPEFYCHSRLATPKSTECYRVAYPGEKCAVAHGIPCVKGSECLAKTKVCSKIK